MIVAQLPVVAAVAPAPVWLHELSLLRIAKFAPIGGAVVAPSSKTAIAIACHDATMHAIGCIARVAEV